MPFARWSRGDRTLNAGAPTYSNDDQTISCPATSVNKCRANRRALLSGKYYLEIVPTWTGTPNAEVQIGFKSGYSDISDSTQQALAGGTPDYWFGFNRGGTAKLPAAGVTSGGVAFSFVSGTVVGIAIDLDNLKVWFRNNGTWASGGDPAAGTTPAFTWDQAVILGLIVGNQSTGVAVQFAANFGDSAFSGSVPSGFTAGLPAETDTAPTALSLRDRFDDTDGTLLENHTPDIGDVWAQFGSTLQTAEIQSGTLVKSATTGNSRYSNTQVVPYGMDNDFTVFVSGGAPNGTRNHQIFFNKDPASQTSYRLDFNAFSLNRINSSGSAIALGTNRTSVPAGSEVVIHVKKLLSVNRNSGFDALDAAWIRVYIDGVLQRDFMDQTASILTAGEVGLNNSTTSLDSILDIAAYDGFQVTIFDVVSVETGVTLTSPFTSFVELGSQQQIEIVSGFEIINSVELSSFFAGPVEAACTLDAPIRQSVEQQCVLSSEIRSQTLLESQIVLPSPIFSQVAVIVTGTPYAEIRGEQIALESASVSIDEGQYAWTCELTLHDPLQISLFQPDDEFSVKLLGESYAFLVNDRSFSRDEVVNLEATVSGIGPGARFANPRARRFSKTWDSAVLVTGVVDELFGSGVVQWEILNWSLPAGRLAVANQTPMDVLQSIAAAAGAAVVSDPDGTLRVRYKFPVPVSQFAITTADQVYHDLEHVLSRSSQALISEFANRLRILDLPPETNQDSLEFEQDVEDAARGVLHIIPRPWRESVYIEHTGKPTVSATLRGVEDDELTETVEVIDGAGTVSKPIHEIVSLEWLYVDLTDVEFELDSTQFTTTHPTLTESLLRITYLTRSIDYDAAAYAGAEVQFLVKEEAA